MEIWEELKKNKECGARRLVDEYGNRLLGAALALCENSQDAEDLVKSEILLFNAAIA